MKVSTLSTDQSFSFVALTDISAEINILLRRLADQRNEIKKEEDDDLHFKLENKYKIEEDVMPENDHVIIEDDLNVEPENVEEKSKRFEDIVKPMLEAPERIIIIDNNKIDEQKNSSMNF